MIKASVIGYPVIGHLAVAGDCLSGLVGWYARHRRPYFVGKQRIRH